MAAREVTRTVREIALRAGADRVAITSAGADDATRARMNAAFARGDLATWRYDGAYAAAATDPDTLLPGARSVVCVAIAYATSRPPGRTPLAGRVSNYAWSRDYHRQVRAVLARIAEELDALAGAPATRVVCDTTPFAERAFAARAGLGWIGKHTNLIAPKLGSFVFLGEVITTLELEPDAALQKSCGACTRCVDACPTGALRGDATIDARRCISDLTQRTDALPRELRPLVGTWVWGCDLCQEVCPPTRQAGLGGSPSFNAEAADIAEPDLLALLRLRSGEYKRRFAPLGLGWRGAATLRRNAAVALGNVLDRSTVDALESALFDEVHAVVRLHIAWALGRIGSPRALTALRRRLSTEGDEDVRAEIGRSLDSWETIGHARAFEAGRT